MSESRAIVRVRIGRRIVQINVRDAGLERIAPVAPNNAADGLYSPKIFTYVKEALLGNLGFLDLSSHASGLQERAAPMPEYL